jgi:hypothetical protein
MAKAATGYQGNSLLKKSGTSIQWTPEMVEEWIKCKDDPVYFTRKYIKIIHVDRGMINFLPYDYQEEIIQTVHDSRYTIILTGRQSGKTTSIVASILHYVTFNDEKTVALLANKGDTAREILSRIQIAFEQLPQWMQHVVVEFNKGSMVLENKCRIIASSTSGSAIRGFSISFLYIDEAAFVENWDAFYKSVYPTISSGKETKIVFTSTPAGLNHYHKLWKDAVEGRSGFTPLKVTWRDVPGRDEQWKKDTIANTSEEAFTQEHEAEFIGSAGTLIDGWRLKELVEDVPIKHNKYLRQYVEVQEGHIYAICADVSRGKGIDNSAFIVADITTLPYRVVSTYYCDSIPPDMFAEVIFQAYDYYNKAFVLVENNDAGCETLRVLNDTYECETLLGTKNDNQNRKVVAIGGGANFEFGVRTTKTVKAVGCSRIKQLIETYSFLFGDKWLIDELNKFIRVGSSYEAQKEAHDDIAMCAVLFGWLTTQYLFEDLTSIDTRYKLREQLEGRFEDELLPFGYITDGMDTYGDDFVDIFGGIELPDYEGTEFFDELKSRREKVEESFDFFLR